MGSRVAHEPVNLRGLDCSTDNSLQGSVDGHDKRVNSKKRRRVSLPRIDVSQTISQDTRDVLSAREGRWTRVDEFGSRDTEQDDCIAVAGRARRGKKNVTVSSDAQGAKFIQESFSFPERQIWLKTKPRQRRGVSTAVQETISPSQEAPSEGETLSLAKHADHIAALIAQKRLENESRSFRERMILQQRLHRGEEDGNDKLIAAGHSELKRKMELSARGIYEERPPGENRIDETASTASLLNGRGVSEQPASPDTVESASVIQPDIYQSQGQISETLHSVMADPASTSDTRRKSGQSSMGIDATGAAVLESENNSLMSPPAIYHHIQQTTSQSVTLMTASAYPQPPALYLAQPRFSNQRIHDTQLQSNEQFPAMQNWTTHMWRALPSTATPVLAHSAVILPSAHTPQQSISTDRANRAQSLEEFASSHQQRDGLELSAAATGVPDGSTFSRSAENPSLLARAVDAAQADHSTVMNRSNTNMFTGKAREDMLIGNNNHYVEPERRRNMFSNRS